jgi:hypothetical protein
MATRNLSETDGRADPSRFRRRVLGALHDLLQRGTVEKIGQGRRVGWRIAELESGLIL